MRCIRSVVVACLVIAGIAAPASAQTGGTGGYGVRAEGPGIKLGESLVLHPGFALVVGHDSNMLYSNSKDPNVYGFYLSLRPVLDMATRGSRDGDSVHNVDFRLHAGSTARFLMTGNNAFNEQHIGIDADVSALLSLYPSGAYTFDIFDNFGRASVPPYFRLERGGNINSISNDIGLRLRWRPGRAAGEGKLGRLETSIMYRFGLFAFEPDQSSALFGNKNYFWNDFQLRVQWRFFPKTALYINAQETLYTYYLRNQDTPPDNYPLRVVVGLNGLITPALRVNVNVGYGNGFYSLPAVCNQVVAPGNPTPPGLAACTSPQTVEGLAELTWSPTLLSAVTLGYRHDFNVSLIGSYYDLDTVYLAGAQQIWRILGTLRFGWEERRYQGDLTLDNQANGRVDDLVTIHVDLSYAIRDWLVVSVGDDVQLNFSNCNFVFHNINSPTAVACDYRRNDAFLKLAVAY